MAVKWHATPPHERVPARKLVGDAWVPCHFSDLRKGDVFRAFDPETGEAIDPVTHEPDEKCVAIAVDDAIKNDPLGSTGQWYGFAVPCDIFESIEALKCKGLS